MYRVAVFYEDQPEAEAYAKHAELCECVPNGTFRHGRVTGAPMGEAPHAYYAEWELADKDAFAAAVRREEFMAPGKAARDRGLPRPTVEFVELS
jgi:hypothetical protein